MRLPAFHLRGPVRWRRLATIAGFLALVAIAADVISGSGPELSEARDALSRVEPGWLIVAAAAEASSYLAFAQGQRIFLQSANRSVRLLPLAGIVTAGQALANCIPAGVAAQSVYVFRQLLLRGIDALVSGEVQVVQTLVYMASLSGLALIGIGVAGNAGKVPDLQYVALGLLGLTVIVIAVGTWLHRRGSDQRAYRWLARRLGRSDDSAGLGAGVSPTRGQWVRATLSIGASWVFDCCCLLAAFLAVGAGPPWRGLLLAYCAGQLASVLPVSPGGLGVVEGSLTVALVAFGGSEGNTLAAVLLYRLFSYWAVLPAGLGAHLLVRRTWTPIRHPALVPVGGPPEAGSVSEAGPVGGDGAAGGAAWPEKEVET